MEDILKFLFIVGIIIIGIVKQVKKEKEKEVSKKTPTPTIPSYKDNKRSLYSGYSYTKQTWKGISTFFLRSKLRKMFHIITLSANQLPHQQLRRIQHRI